MTKNHINRGIVCVNWGIGPNQKTVLTETAFYGGDSVLTTYSYSIYRFGVHKFELLFSEQKTQLFVNLWY